MHTQYIQLYLLGFFITMLILINNFKIFAKLQYLSSQHWRLIFLSSIFFPVHWTLLLFYRSLDMFVFLLYESIYLLKKLWKALIKERKLNSFKHLNK